VAGVRLQRDTPIALKFGFLIAVIGIKSFRKPIVKIDSTTSTQPDSLTTGVTRTQQDGPTSTASTAQGAATTAQAATSSGGDANVSLSGLSSDLRNLAASGSADIDTAHVEAIKAAISNGTLTIDPGKIADGVLETTRSLLQTRAPATGD
jgi:negative regulator of flagellin synthesis FlgM